VNGLAMITGGYRRRSETFIVRQAESLGATVLCGNDENFNQSGPTTVRIIAVGDERYGLRGGRWSRMQASLWRRFGSRRGFCIPRTIAARLSDELRRLSPAAALVQFGSNAIRCWPVLQRVQIPFVAHFHGYDASSALLDRAYRSAIQDVFRTSKAVVGVSREMCQKLIDAGCDADKVHHIPYGIPIVDVVPDRTERSVIGFLSVGNFVEKKAPHLTLQAFQDVLKRCPNGHLTMIGAGPLFSNCEKYVQEHGLLEHVTLMGGQPFSVVRQHFASADVFLQHSVTTERGETEGWPNAIGEAASFGLPVVATRHAGISEQIIDGRTGFLVAERDVKSMSDAMFVLAQDAELRRQMGVAAKLHIDANFALPDQITKLRRLLTE
jgi:colanic acid/amylovoran biosynthesis glycosyltransferase